MNILRDGKYSCEKIGENKSYVWHNEGENKTLIAVTDTFEKADFLTKAANQFSEAFWTEEMILRYAELYRWSSGRITMKGFLEDTNGWQKVDIKEAKEFQMQEDTGKAYKGQETVTDEEIRNAAGHFDAIPKVYIDHFVRGARWMRSAIWMRNIVTQSVPPYKEEDKRFSFINERRSKVSQETKDKVKKHFDDTDKQYKEEVDKDRIWKKYKRKGLSEMRPYLKGEDLTGISVNKEDNPETDLGMVARNPKNHNDQWYVARKYFEDNLEEVLESKEEAGEEKK